ncbi:MAG: DUF2795 domain-containing protein [Dehalococcoidia bacterium]
MVQRRHAEPREFVDALEGLDFPASQAAIQNKAQDKGGIDAEVTYVLRHLPDRTYDSIDDLNAEIAQIYASGIALPDAAPAAPTAASKRDKQDIETQADTREGEPPGESRTGQPTDFLA